jgi:hypothetical protein
MGRLSEAMQTQLFNAASCFCCCGGFLSICRRFRHFCKDRWLSRAPGCKVLMKHCFLVMYETFETSCLMNASFFTSLFTLC